MSSQGDRAALLPPTATARQYGLHPPVDEEQPGDEQTALLRRNTDRGVRSNQQYSSSSTNPTAEDGDKKAERGAKKKKSTDGLNFTSTNETKTGPLRFVYCVIYALVNVIISAPGLYGYAAVIFNHPVFENHMNALSKLVIFSSLVHQLGFFLFSSLDFAIGTVQDAGLIFLSSMANKIADTMLEDGHSEEEIVATTLVLLSLGTAILGLCLIVVGKAGLADAVSYLPMPVVGGYLAFIGYFCCQAGVALCISKALVTFSDWTYLFNERNLMLAAPGLGAGLILTLASRKISNDAALPLIMVSIPASFYALLYFKGESLETAREEGWVGQVAPSVPVSDLIKLIDFSLIQWGCWVKIVTTWIGMVFVVSFASCLDVAAISIDMGEALDTNHELATVGISNLMSGLSMGFTGSYIFSQTIFTYRTGVHSRWIGVLIMCVFLYIVVSPVNILQIAPLFFLGSTLIFIGYDLLYEWLWEIRNQVFLSEYCIVWLTFVAIQIVGIDAGIILGVLIAVVEQVVLTAKTSNMTIVQKRSRAIWSPDENKILHKYAYNTYLGPQIVTMELTGTIFFGSALQILNRIIDEIGLKGEPAAVADYFKSPRTPHAPSLVNMQRRRNPDERVATRSTGSRPPKFLVLDLLYVTHLDASATRGCFLQLAKLCAKHGIIVCASGVTPRIEWMFRSHGVSYKSAEEETEVKGRLQSRSEDLRNSQVCDLVLLFVSVQDALEFCEGALLHTYSQQRQMPMLTNLFGPKQQSFTSVLAKLINATDEEKKVLARLEDGQRYHEERDLKKGEVIFHYNTHADSFVVVLQGAVANNSGNTRAVGRLKGKVISGAGKVDSRSDLLDPLFLKGQQQKEDSDVIAMLWSVGAVVGYLDYLLDRPRLFRLIAQKEGTRVAIVNNSHMNLLKSEDTELYSLIQRALLCAASSDLANCTCDYS